MIPASPPKAVARLHPLLDGFEHWATVHRGPRPRTTDEYIREITTVLLPLLGEDAHADDAAQLRGVVRRFANGRSRSTAKCHVTALRAFLRFLAVQGACSPDLVQAVPGLPQWRLSELPRYLEPDEVQRLLDSCSRSTRYGLRNRAVLLLLVRLGLRAGDIVRMCLDDIDWDAGALRVLGKGRKEEMLP